jgi:hypothetical protein
LRALRVKLEAPYEGHWIAFNPNVPWRLFEDCQTGVPGAGRRFILRSVVAWSFGETPRKSRQMREAMPWDLELMIPRVFDQAHKLTDAEEEDLFKRVWVHQSALNIPEFDRQQLCERLGVAFASTFDDLKAGETLRLIRAMNAYDEILVSKPGKE